MVGREDYMSAICLSVFRLNQDCTGISILIGSTESE